MIFLTAAAGLGPLQHQLVGCLGQCASTAVGQYSPNAVSTSV